MQTLQQTMLKVKSATQTMTAAPLNLSSNAAPCDHCGGSKFIRFDVALDDPRFGRAFPCPVCNQEGVTANSGLKEHERLITFDSIVTEGRKDTVKMVKAAREFTENPKGFLSIYGGFGNGKTTTLYAIINTLLARGVEARYMTAAELLAYMRETFNEETKESDYSRIVKLAGVSVLCIDEMDKLRDTPYSREIQQELFNRRYRDAGTFGTVFAWNGEFSAFNMPAITSRMSEFTMVQNNDTDMRRLIGVSK